MFDNTTDKIEYYQKNRELLKELWDKDLIENMIVNVKDEFVDGESRQVINKEEIKIYSDSENNGYQKLVNLIDSKKTEHGDLFLLETSFVEETIHIESITFKDGFLLTPKNEEEKGFENLFIEDITLFIK